jgi:hypothetical protein
MSIQSTIPQSQFLLYQNDNGKVNIEVFIQNETIWLTQKKMAELFQVSIPTINEHLKSIYISQELTEVATIRKFLTVQNEGKMNKFADSVNKFLEFNEYKVLENKGSISHDIALKKAHDQYDIFNKKQVIDSDFEKFIQRTKNINPTKN